MSAANAPTHGAKEAMLANGLDYKNYQKKIDHIDVDPFVANVAAQYGVKLNKSAVAGLSKVFKDPKVLNDPALFTPAVTGLLKHALGKDDAQIAQVDRRHGKPLPHRLRRRRRRERAHQRLDEGDVERKVGHRTRQCALRRQGRAAALPTRSAIPKR